MEYKVLNKSNQQTVQVYLFDWGNTLMVDFSDCTGKMCEWQKVEALPDAKKVLAKLSTIAKIFIATSAADSTENEIKMAFQRVDLSDYISGYFCKENLGIEKGTADFFPAIISKLNLSASQITMVGDTYEKDIGPAITAGINAIWFAPTATPAIKADVKIIKSLKELLTSFDNKI